MLQRSISIQWRNVVGEITKYPFVNTGTSSNDIALASGKNLSFNKEKYLIFHCSNT